MTENIRFGTFQHVEKMAYKSSSADNNYVMEIALYGDSRDNLKYGGLYPWHEIVQYKYVNVDITAYCPQGWVIPSEQDFQNLMLYGVSEVDKLFQPTYGGCGIAQNGRPIKFDGIEKYGLYWTSTKSPGSKHKFARFVSYKGRELVGVYYYTLTDQYFAALRCIKK